MKSKPKIIFWDLETLPNLLEAMKVFARLSAYPGLTMKATHNTIICFGWKILGDARPKCVSAWDFPERWSQNINDDYEVVKFAYETLLDADAIVTQNGKSFDWKFLQTRLLFHGFPPLPKIQHIDTKLLARRNLFLFNNSLETMGKFLTSIRKMDNGGWDLWVEVASRNEKSQRKMAAYCKQDVEVLEKIFLKLRPFATELPNANLYRKDGAECCPNCGSFKVQQNGLRTTKHKIAQRWLCQECGTSFSTSKDKKPKTL